MKMDLPKSKNSEDKLLNEEKKRAELRAAIIKKKEYQSKVMAIVEKLLENPVDRTFFEEKAVLIDPATYQDVVEERAIVKICGYPLCSNQLLNIPKQQYKISLKSNKVYDITDRKNFCCNGCYQASCHLKSQLWTSPVWTRDINERIKLTFLPHGGTSNLVGEEVRLVPIISPKDVEFTSVNDAMSALANELDDMSIEDERERKRNFESEKETKVELESERERKSDFENEREGKKDLVPEVKGIKTVSFSEDVKNAEVGKDQIMKDAEDKPASGVKEQFETKEQESNTKVEQSDKPKQKIKRKPGKAKTEKVDAGQVPLPSLHVEKTLQEWFTIDSLRFILGSDTVNLILAEREKALKMEKECEKLDIERYERLLERLDKMDAEEGILEKAADERAPQPKRPLPSYEELKKETGRATAKVAAFLSGKTVTETFAEGITIKEKEDKEKESDEKPIFLPPIDSQSQNALRRQIVLNRLHMTIPDLMRTFDMGNTDISHEVRDLALTFKFSAENIVHEPYHWSLIGLALIYFVSRQDHTLKVKIEAETSQKFIKMMLMGFSLDSGYLERLVSWLTDVTLRSVS